MTMFASRENSPAEQRALLAAIIETFDAVDVTGLSAWEKARLVHGRTAAGLAEGEPGVGVSGAYSRGPSSGGPKDRQPTPSASPVATPLFEEAA